MTLEQTGATVARKQVSRRKLLDAARTLFTERGYHDTRPQDIARAAGVGHGTFYLHFADKRECFLAFVDEAASELQQAVLEYTQEATDLSGYLRAIFAACAEYVREHPGVLPAAMSDASVIGGEQGAVPLMERWGHEWTERLQMLMDKGMIATDLDPRVIGHVIIGACHHGYMGAMRDGLESEEATENVIKFIARALAPAKR